MIAVLTEERRDLAEPLAVSHTVVRGVDLVRLEVAGPGPAGVGEVTVGPWDRTPTADVCAAVRALTDRLTGAFPANADDVRLLLAPAYGRAPAAATLVVEMALLDALSHAAGVPLWTYLGLPAPVDLPLFTTVDLHARGYPWDATPGRYKVKLGGAADAEVLASCARAAGSSFLFDVNSGWDVPTYRAHEAALAACRPLGVEDPLCDVAALESLRGSWRERRIFLDESVRSVDAARAVADAAAGVNVKLLKFGGLLPALDGIRAVRSGGAQVMIGCFAEPARAIAYAATLTGLADLADLDGERWLTGRVRAGGLVASGAGIGVPA